MSILEYIYEFVWDFFVEPISNFFLNHFDALDFQTPISLTMPGSNVVLLTASVNDFLMLGISIFLLIASMSFFWGVVKMLYKVGRSMFGGKR